MVYTASPASLKAWLDAGLEAHQQGDIERALAAYRQVLAAAPDHPAALRLLGTGLLQRGDAGQAVSFLERAARRQADDPHLLANLAQAYLALQRYADAGQAFRKASRLAPNEVQLQVGIAAALAMQGKLEEARTMLSRQAERFPNAPLVWFNLGNVLRDTREPDQAIGAYRRALELEPGMSEAQNSLGSVLHSVLRFDEAQREYRACIEADPDYILARYNLASVTMDLGRFAEAESIAREIAARAPNVPEGQRLVAAALVHQGRLLEALPWHRRSAELAPDSPQSARAYGISLMQTAHAGAGLRWLAHAAALEPGASDQSTSGVLLAHGSIQEGWNAYKNRPAAAAFRERHPDVDLVQTLPPVLEGRRVCIIAEQGLGDQLFFLRYTALLATRGAVVIHRADRKLDSLLRRVASMHEVVAHDAPLPPAAFYLLAGDLPRALSDLPASLRPRVSTGVGTSAGMFEPARNSAVFWPPLSPSLRIEALPQKLAETRAQLAALGPPPYIGITWRGGIAPQKQRTASWLLYKSVGLAELARTLRNVPGTFLALQREPDDSEIGAFSAALAQPVHDMTSLNEDLEGMLALLSTLDEYVGVSNTNMHLRAATGRAARVLVPVPAEWRWMEAGRESPWFPGFSVYRQSLCGDWSAALAALGRELQVKYGRA